MTPAEAVTRYGSVYKATGRGESLSTVHTRETCRYVADSDTRELVHPGELPLSASLCGHCGPGDGQGAVADGGQTSD